MAKKKAVKVAPIMEIKEPKGFDYASINGVPYNLKVVGAKIKEGTDGKYLLVTSRSIDNPAMPSVRANLSFASQAQWRRNQFLKAIGLQKVASLAELIGKEFSATVVAHPFNGNSFIDVNKYFLNGVAVV